MLATERERGQEVLQHVRLIRALNTNRGHYAPLFVGSGLLTFSSRRWGPEREATPARHTPMPGPFRNLIARGAGVEACTR